MILRDYQSETITNAHKIFETKQSALAVQATGTGKTVVAAHMLKGTPKRGIFLAHRSELIYQAQATIGKVALECPDIEMADQEANRMYPARFVCTSIQTMMNGRYKEFNPSEFSLVIQDEAHHSTAKSFRRVLDHFTSNPECKLLGLTATPDRTDKEALGQIYDEVAINFGILEAIEGGWLVPVKANQVFIDSLDLAPIKTRMGDLSNNELARVMEFEENLHGVAGPLIDLCGDRKTLVFAASVDQAERLSEILNRHKPQSADWVCGKTDTEKRKEMFAAYERGDFQFLVNVGVATEGFDEPGIEVVALARPTKSRSLYSQMVGRGTRPIAALANRLNHVSTPAERQQMIAASVKPFLEVIDFVGNSGNHKLITATDILGGKYSDQVVELALKNIEKKRGTAVEVEGELAKAEREIAQRRKEALDKANRSMLTLQAAFSLQGIDPFDVLKIEKQAVPGWDRGREPTPRQIKFLESWNVDMANVETIGVASQLIEEIKKRQKGRMPFGKHKGKLISDVPKGYLNWYCDQPWAKKDLKQEMQNILNDRRAG